MTELWRDIPGYEGLYQVSNAGRVKSLARLSAPFNGNVYTVRERVLKPWMQNAGYLVVGLNSKARRKEHLVHRLVASAFISNPERLPIVNHINGVKTDNRVDNLEWCSEEFNAWHNAYTLKHESTKVKRRVVCLDDSVIYASATEAARSVGGCNQNIIKCCQGLRTRAYGRRWAYAEEEKDL